MIDSLMLAKFALNVREMYVYIGVIVLDIGIDDKGNLCMCVCLRAAWWNCLLDSCKGYPC